MKGLAFAAGRYSCDPSRHVVLKQPSKTYRGFLTCLPPEVLRIGPPRVSPATVFFPDATVPGSLLNVDFMVKDSQRLADSGGWGYAVFDYDAASDTFKPGTTAGTPPQGTMPSAGSHATRERRREITFSRSTGSGDQYDHA